MKYKIVEEIVFSSENIVKFEVKVNNCIKKGYVPQGGLVIIERKSNNQTFYYLQAMVKNEI